MMAVSVLAHELGHSMNSWYADETHLGIYMSFGTFSMSVAETASNFNQALLADYMQKAYADDPNIQLALLDAIFFNFHRYFFIMPLLARFGVEEEPMGGGASAEAIEPWLPDGACVVPVEGAGHFVHMEKPRDVAREVLEFLT